MPMSLVLWLLLAMAPLACAGTLTVTTASDTVRPDGVCSLREALEAVNWLTTMPDCGTGTEATVILVPAGYYGIDPAQGRLPIRRGLTLRGQGPDVTVLDGLRLGPLFLVDVIGTSPVMIEGFDLRSGDAWNPPVYLPGPRAGGAIAHQRGRLTVANVWCANHLGGCLATFPPPERPLLLDRVHIVDAAMWDNQAPTGAGVSGQGMVHLQRTTMQRNDAPLFRTGGDGGGLTQRSGTLILEDVRITGNTAADAAHADCAVGAAVQVELRGVNVLGLGCPPTDVLPPSGPAVAAHPLRWEGGGEPAR